MHLCLIVPYDAAAHRKQSRESARRAGERDEFWEKRAVMADIMEIRREQWPTKHYFLISRLSGNKNIKTGFIATAGLAIRSTDKLSDCCRDTQRNMRVPCDRSIAIFSVKTRFTCLTRVGACIWWPDILGRVLRHVFNFNMCEGKHT